MATRTISTKLAIEGESEYRASLSRINTELKTLQSNLKLTESQYQGNANSMAALKAKGEALDHLYEAQKTKVEALKNALENAKTAQGNYAQKSEELRAKIAANTEQLEKLRKSTGDTSAEEAKLVKENEALTAKLSENERSLAAAEKGVNSWQAQLNNAEVKLNDLDAELKKNDALMDEAKNSADGCAHSIDEFGNETKESGDAVQALAQALAAAGVAKTVKEIADALRACVDSSIAFESAMAGVKRTVGGGDAFVADLGDSFKQLATQIPITTTELGKIAETAGQLGIKQQNVEQFTTVMAKLATTTDLTADSAATMLAQFANITGVTDYERLGSVVAALGDSTATTASKVVEMGQGMAAAASVAGLSERDILAISAAVGSLGIESQAGSTAMSTLISTIYKAVESGGQKLNDFASVSGMSAAEFKIAWQTDAVGALNAFITGLNDTERNGKSAIQILDDLDIKNVRQTKAILGLSEAGDLLSRTISLSNRAWEENSALNEKAGIMYQTTEAKIQKYRNSVDNLKIAIGDQLTPALGNLAEKGTSVTSWAAEMVEKNEWLAPTITAVATSMGAFLTTLTGAVTVVPMVKDAFVTLHTALQSNPYALVAAAIAAVVTALVTLAATMPETENEYRNLTATSKDQYDKILKLNEEYKKACELYGENSEEARKLAAQIDAETQIFDANKTTLAEVTQKTDDLIESSQKLREESSGTAEAISKSYESTSYLIGRLDSLMGEEEKSAGTKQQILAVVDALNQQIPDLGLAYDAYSDKLSTTTDRLLELAKAEADRLKAAADYQHLIELEMQQSEISAQLTKVQEERETAERRLIEAKKAQSEAEEQYGNLQAGTIGQMIAYAQKTDGVTAAVIDAQAAVDQLTEDEQRLTQEAERCAEEIQGLATAHTELAESSESAANVEAAAADSISEKLDALAERYAAAYESAQQSIEGQFGLWEKAPSVTAKSVEEMLEALNTQADWWQWYSEYVEELRGRDVEGVDEFLAKFADGSAESASILMGLSTASDEEFAKVIAAMNRVGENESTVTGSLASLRTNLTGELGLLAQEFETTVTNINGTTETVDFTPFNDAVKTAFEKVGAEFETAGSDAGTGLQNGIVGSSGQVYKAANDMAQGIVDAAKTVLNEHSPSQVMHDIGGNADIGLAEGIGARAEDVTTAAEDLANSIVTIMTDAGHDSVEGFDSELAALEERTREHLEEAKRIVEESAPDLAGGMESVGVQMVQGMIDGLYGESGNLYNAVTDIVNQAIDAARVAADVHSPSKKTESIFEDVGEGMIVGVEKKKEDVAAATKDVVNEALRIDASSLRTASELLTMHAPDMSSLIAPPAVAASAQSVGDIAINIDMTGTVIREEADIRKISQELAHECRVALRQKGVL